MLKTLRSIIQEVNGARDLDDTLGIIVRRVKKALDTRVCSVYLLDPDLGRYVLMASNGLESTAVGRVSLVPQEGLVGLVAKRAEPLNLADARRHPNFKYLPETGEEVYISFLGVPIIHHRNVLGVLVVQQDEIRDFGAEEEAFLITLSAQVAGVIANAEARGALAGFSPSGAHTSDAVFHGVPGASGVAIAEVVAVIPAADLNQVPNRSCEDIEAEIRFFNDCLEQVRVDISELKAKVEVHMRPEERELFDAYLHMLDDQALGAEVLARIKEGNWAQGAVAQVAMEYVEVMEDMDNDYLSERATDIKDLCGRVLLYLQNKQKKERRFPARCILASEDLSAALLAEVPKENLVGVVSAKGSAHAHVAILARAMGIPAVMGCVDLPFSALDGREIIIDGYNGQVFTSPSDELREYYMDVAREEEQLTEGLQAIRDLPCETTDAHRIALWVNTGMMTDVLRSLERGAEGVGLFRTEVPFQMRDRFPTEKEQTHIYRQQLEAFYPKMVTMRTLDIGGDKPLAYFPIKEENPFMGWRGIRVNMDHPEIYITQVRAMMRASMGLDNLQILLPMVTTLQELDYAKKLFQRVYAELQEEGMELKRPPFGVMIEVPAAACLAKAFAEQVDYVSVGSNDLTQYLLAVDRNNPRVSSLFSNLHPAVLQVLNGIVKNVHAAGRKVSICGEMAGNPGSALLLMAMGFDVLSMNATNLLKVKSVIRGFSMAQAQDLLARVLEQDSTESVKALIDIELYNAGVDRLLRSSRVS